MPATALDPKTALVVIDLQKGIAAYPTVHPMKEIVAHTVKLADAFRAKKLPVILVSVNFSPDGGDRLVTRTEVPARALPSNPEFAQIVPELGPQASDLLIVKHQQNAFYGTELELQLRRRGVTGLVLTGVATGSGVESTARAAHERGFNLTFAADAITDLDAATHEHVMKKVFPRLGEIDASERVVALLSHQ